MSYKAIITPLTNIRKHSNADRLNLATCVGNQVVIGLDHAEGELGVYFPSDGQLSHEMCIQNNLYNKSACAHLGLNPTQFGFFDHNRRVRAQAFRGEKSDGLWLPLNSLSWYPTYKSDWAPQAGDLIETDEIATKYVTKATRMQGQGNKERKVKRGEAVGFPKHYDTENFQYYYQDIPEGSIIYLTEKLHGTSGRYGYVKEVAEDGLVDRILGWCGYHRNRYSYLNGSRNVVLEHTAGEGYYGTNDFRTNAVKSISLRKGEVIYFELVGDVAPGSNIMPDVNVPKELRDTHRQYGEVIRYRYGCASGECALYVYRIVQFNEDGQGVDLSWPQVKRRAKEIGIKTVPELVPDAHICLDHTPENGLEGLKSSVEKHSDGKSLLDSSHIREGVCVRVETPDGQIYCLKNKSYTFKVLEGIVKMNEEYIDVEESN